MIRAREGIVSAILCPEERVRVGRRAAASKTSGSADAPTEAAVDPADRDHALVHQFRHYLDVPPLRQHRIPNTYRIWLADAHFDVWADDFILYLIERLTQMRVVVIEETGSGA